MEFVLLNYPPSNSFYQICQMQDRRNGKIFRDEEQSVPYYVTGNTWVGYDDIYSVKNKVSSSLLSVSVNLILNDLFLNVMTF